MSELLKFIKNGFIFCISSITIYAALVLLLTIIKVNGLPLIYRTSMGLVFKGGDSYRRFREFDKEKQYDILVFGSSVANRGIAPQILERSGHSLYNLATDDQTLLNTEVLVKSLVKAGKVKIVIIDLFETVVDQSPLESTGDIIENSASDHAAWCMTICSKDVRSVNMFASRFTTKYLCPLYKEPSSLYMGYKPLPLDKHPLDMETQVYHGNDNQMCALENIIRILIKNNIQIYPIHLPKSPFFQVVNQSAFFNDVNKILKKYNLTLNDYSLPEYNFTNDYFYDNIHLNRLGAKKITKLILPQIVSMLKN